MRKHTGAASWLERDSDNATAIPTTPTTPVSHLGHASTPTALTPNRATARVLSYLSDENEEPLAVPLSRRDRFLQLTSVLSAADAPPPPPPVVAAIQSPKAKTASLSLHADRPASTYGDENTTFHQRLLSGRHTRLPERASYVLRRRTYATMTDGGEGRAPLPLSIGDIRLRHEHVTQVPLQKLFWPPMFLIPGSRYEMHTSNNSKSEASMPSTSVAHSSQLTQANDHPAHVFTVASSAPTLVAPKCSGIMVSRNALAREMDGLQRILHSLEVRKYDMCKSDVYALFAWLKHVETFVRCYLSITESAIYMLPCAERRALSYSYYSNNNNKSNSITAPNSTSSATLSPTSPPSNGSSAQVQNHHRSQSRSLSRSPAKSDLHHHSSKPFSHSHIHGHSRRSERQEHHEELFWGASKRRAEKEALAALCDRLEELRRPMLAKDGKAHELLTELKRRCDAFATRLMLFMDGEVRVVDAVLQVELSCEELDATLASVVAGLRNKGGSYGKDLILLMATGLDVSKSERETWIKERTKAMSRFIVQLGVKRLTDRHWKFVTLFERAASEYKHMYDGLAHDIDVKVATAQAEQRKSDSA